jgi:hypothetical protein
VAVVSKNDVQQLQAQQTRDTGDFDVSRGVAVDQRTQVLVQHCKQSQEFKAVPADTRTANLQQHHSPVLNVTAISRRRRDRLQTFKQQSN